MNLIRRLLLRAYSALRCAIYSQRIADASNILRQHDIPARRHIALTMRRAKHQASLAAARADYNATFPPGVRRTWAI